MKHILSVLLICIATTLILSRAAAEEADVVARIGEKNITVAEIRDTLAALQPAQQVALDRDPALLNRAVRILLVQKLLLDEAQSNQWEKRPDVSEKLQRAREQVIVDTYLESVAAPPAGYPGEADITAAYEKAKPSLVLPKQFRIAQIFIATPKTTDKDDAAPVRAKFEKVRTSLDSKSVDFAALAKEYSDETQSAENGGEIGWLAEAQIEPEIRTRVTNMKVGEVSEAVRLDDGWHFIKLLEVKQSRTATLHEVRDQLSQRLRAERTQVNTQAYLARLLQENPVAVNELALSKVFETSKR